MEIITEIYNFDELEVEEPIFYYHTYPGIDNCFTACILLDDTQQLISRGVAICSLMDTHNKKIGRRNALGRAVRAIRRHGWSSPIDLSSGGTRDIEFVSMKCDITYKSSDFINQIKDAAIDNKIKLVDIYKPDKPTRTIALFDYPFTLPIQHAGRYFNCKSEIYPNPTDYEKEAFHAKLFED